MCANTNKQELEGSVEIRNYRGKPTADIEQVVEELGCQLSMKLKRLDQHCLIG